jgi:hypothetical protein
VAHFKVWLRKHHGASDPTIKLYARDATHLMAALGDDPERWEPAAIRNFSWTARAIAAKEPSRS